MIPRIAAPPMRMDALAWYPYSVDLEKTLKHETKFEGVVNLATVVGHNLLVPRGLAMGKPVLDKRSDGSTIHVTMKNPPRNLEQKRVIEKSTGNLLLGQDHILRATTGFGKTYCGLSIAANVGRNTLIIVTKDDLMEQWRKAILTHTSTPASKIGIIQQDQCDYVGKDFVIAMVHSLIKDKYPWDIKTHFGTVIFDEVHRMAADTFQLSCGMFTARHRLGLSATPKRVDGKEFIFEAHIGPVLVSSSLLQVPPKIIFQKTKFRLPMVIRRTKTGYTKVPLPHSPGKLMGVYKEMAKDMHRNSQIIHFVKKAYDKDRRIIVFSDLKESHLQVLYELAHSEGIPEKDMDFYVGGMKEKAREAAKHKRVLFATYAMTAEATDIPWLDTAVLATPRANVVQTVGRILREWENKKQPVVFDLVDECSHVLRQYAMKRHSDYLKMGATIVGV